MAGLAISVPAHGAFSTNLFEELTMPIGRNMPVGTKVKHSDGRTGSTTAYLKDMQPAGGYKVKWDADSSESDVRVHELDLAGGAVSIADYNQAVALVTTRLGGVDETAEGQWLNNRGKLVDSVLVVSRPKYLKLGEELHAHVNAGGGIRRAHIKHGEKQVRVIFDNGGCTGQATTGDLAWVADYKLRGSLQRSKQDYLDSKLPLPK
jgi:hypothetical protein